MSQQLHSLVQASNGALGFAAIIALLLALWSASRGMSGMITAINIAYEEKERRGFFKLNLMAIGLTLGLLAGGIVAISLVAILPAAVQLLAVGAATKWLLLLVQWPLLIVLVMLGLAVLYRFGPSRDKPQWRWVSPGAGAATLLWIVASVGFTVYVANFNSYDKTYGSLGGVIILLTWLYLSALTVLLGAAINAQAENRPGRIPRKDRPDRWGSAARTPPTRLAKAPGRRAPMERNEEIDRLQSRLHWESGGPLAHLADQAVHAFASRAGILAAWVRERAEERPLVSLLCAFQLGLAAGRWGPRRARR
jgi:membrane protein